MILGSCRAKIYIVEYNSNCVTTLITVGDMKLARNGTFYNTEHEETIFLAYILERPFTSLTGQ